MTVRHKITDPDPTAKTGSCSQCGPVTIYRSGSYKGRDYYRCVPSHLSRQMERYREDPDLYQTTARFKRLYGISLEDYSRMLDEQGGVCARCKKPPQTMRLAVDHCHKTGRVRGLLCGPCNTYLGRLEANLDQLQSDLLYLDLNRLGSS